MSNENESTLSDILEDESPTPEEELTQNLLIQDLNNLLKDLNQKEASALKLRFGLIDNIPRTLHQVGEIMHISRERVRQIESQALSKLRQPDKLMRIYDYLKELKP